jgi:hypothetical protein
MKIVQKTPDWIGAKGVCGFCNCEVELEECDGLPISKENPLYKLGDYWVGQELLKINLVITGLQLFKPSNKHHLLYFVQIAITI